MNLMKCSLCKMSFILKVFFVGIFIFILSNYETFCNDDLFHLSNSSHIDVLINDGSISKNIINDNISSVHIDTNNLSKGYYTASLLKRISGDFSNYSGISFYIKTNDTLKINLDLQSILGNNYKIIESSKILISYEDGNYYEGINGSYTLFEIPKGFSGRVFIPFSNMYDENGNNVINDLNSLDIIRVIVGLEENNTKDFEIGDFAFICSDSSVNDELFSDTYIIGDNESIIPVEGQNISKYSLYSKNGYLKEVNFYLKNYVEGVYITKDGKLTVSSNAKEQSVQIISVFGDSKYIKSINLKKKITAIPSVDEAQSVGSDSWLLNNYFIYFIRVMLFVLFVLCIFVYKKWRKKLDLNKEINF